MPQVQEKESMFILFCFIKDSPQIIMRAVPLKNPRIGKTPPPNIGPRPRIFNNFRPPRSQIRKVDRTPRFTFVPQTPNSKIFMVIWP